MKFFAILTILFGITLSASRSVIAQDLSRLDQQNLTRAGITADRFVKRFNQTRDFGTVWKEFHMSDVSCTIAANVFSEADYKRLQFKERLLERLYIATMNYYYLKVVHEVHVSRMDGNYSEEALTPREIRVAESKSTYVKTNGKEPDSVREVEEMILELNRLARLYRKYTPVRIMSSRAWRAKAAYFESKNVPLSDWVKNGNETFCVPENVKVYIVEKGIFYFYFVEENGNMRVAGLGIGN